MYLFYKFYAIGNTFLYFCNKMETVNKIRIEGATFLTISSGKEGHLRLFTHKDTKVSISDNTLFIKDPPKEYKTTGNTVWHQGTTINMGSPGVIAVNNGNTFQCNVFRSSGNGSSYTIQRSNNSNLVNVQNMTIVNGRIISSNNNNNNNNTMTVMGSPPTTKEECSKEHHIKCDYSHIKQITSDGSMESTINIPLDPKRCDISLKGQGGIQINNEKQSLSVVSLNLTGNGDVMLCAQLIGKLIVSLCGNGDIGLSDCQHIDDASITLTGNGDIDMGGAVIEIAKVTLTGNGDIKDFTIVDEATIKLSGHGDVKCKAAKRAHIKKVLSGTGSAKVTRLSL